MSNSQGSRREIIRLPEFPCSATPEPAPKKQRTSRSSSNKPSGIPKEARIATTASVLNTSDRASSSRVTRSAGMESPSDREREPLEQLVVEPARDPQEAALEDARVTDSPTRALNSSERLGNAGSACVLNTSDKVGEARVTNSPTRVLNSSERLSEPSDIPQVAASWTPPRCTTSTWDDTGEMPTTTMEHAAWDSSADPLWPKMGADGTSIAVVAETSVHSALPSSTEVSTELRDSHPALDDDGVQSSGTETGEAQSISGILPSHASVNDAITRLQRERDLALRRLDELHVHYKKQLKSQDDNNNTAIQWRIDECEKRVNQHAERLFPLQSDMDAAIAKRDALLEKANKELKDARDKADDAQHGTITMFNMAPSHIDRMQDDVRRAKIAVDKMRDEVVRLRSKINDLRDERSNLKKQHEARVAEDEAILQDRDSVIADLRSMLDRRNHELDSLEQSVGTIQEERTRIQLHSNEVPMSTVVLRQELDAARAETTTARASEEAGRLQLARPMDEQLAQNQTIDALRRQVEASNNSSQQAQALLRSNQEQQLQNARMLSPTNYPSGQGGNIGNTPFIPPLSTPSTGLRTRELHGPGYYPIGSPADQGYTESMRSMYGRDEIDPTRQEPPRHDPPSMGSSSRGPVVNLLRTSVGNIDPAKMSQHSQAVALSQLGG